jgi:hypothetical protein
MAFSSLSRFHFLPPRRSFPAHIFGAVSTFVLFWASPAVIPTRVRRYLFTHYTLEILLNHVFEDLRKPKAPNTSKINDLARRASRRASALSRGSSPRRRYSRYGICQFRIGVTPFRSTSTCRASPSAAEGTSSWPRSLRVRVRR